MWEVDQSAPRCGSASCDCLYIESDRHTARQGPLGLVSAAFRKPGACGSPEEAPALPWALGSTWWTGAQLTPEEWRGVWQSTHLDGGAARAEVRPPADMAPCRPQRLTEHRSPGPYSPGNADPLLRPSQAFHLTAWGTPQWSVPPRSGESGDSVSRPSGAAVSGLGDQRV